MRALEYCLVRLILATLRYPPLGLAMRIGALYAHLFDLAAPRLRKVALRNLELAGLGARPDIVDGVFESISRILVTFARFPDIGRNNIRDWIDYQGLEYYKQAKSRGKGVLFATAHLGNWELSAFAHALMTEPMHVVVRPLDNSKIDDLVETRRQMSGNTVISKKDAARAILKALRANDAVGILVDQNSMPEEGVFIDFFGHKACSNSAFARIAAYSGATVIPGFALWSKTDRRYVLRFYEPFETTGDMAADTQRLHSALEQVIREYPDQWLWIHKRWKTRPPGEASLY
ncbi:MAG: lysophospholipid acyltransferase family protein [Acidobacteria bacterium]|nr:lysophospholipid acyltransferase family protein [Acidobacteriota bacterium]